MHLKFHKMTPETEDCKPPLDLVSPKDKKRFEMLWLQYQARIAEAEKERKGKRDE